MPFGKAAQFFPYQQVLSYVTVLVVSVIRILGTAQGLLLQWLQPSPGMHG